MTNIRLYFTPSVEDYLKTYRAFMLTDPRNWIFTGVSIVLFVWIFFAIQNGEFGEGLPTWFSLVVFAITLAGIFLFPLQRLKNQVRKHDGFTSTVTWEITDRNLFIKSPFKDSTFYWNDFGKVRELKEYYLLFSSENRRLYYFLPKNAFDTLAEQQAFSQFIKEKISSSK